MWDAYKSTRKPSYNTLRNLVFANGNLFFKILYQLYPNLSSLVSPQHVRHEFCLHLHLDLQATKRVDDISGDGWHSEKVDIELTISREPLNTPHKTLLNHSPPSNASSGNSTNSANGFSSKVREKDARGVAPEAGG